MSQDDISLKKCKGCSKSVENQFVRCNNCGNVYHESCALKVRGLKSMSDGMVECCKKITRSYNMSDSLMEENLLLRQLVEEMKDKNLLLKDKIQLLEEKTPRYQGANYCSCQNALSMESRDLSKNSVSLGRSNDFDDKKEKSEQNISTSRRQSRNSNSSGDGIKIDDSKTESLKFRNNSDTSKSPEKVDVSVEVDSCKTLKIVDMESEMTEDEIVTCIQKQNPFIDKTKKIEVLLTRKMPKGYMAIINCAEEEFDKILREGHLNIGWDVCRVFENVKMLR